MGGSNLEEVVKGLALLALWGVGLALATAAFIAFWIVFFSLVARVL